METCPHRCDDASRHLLAPVWERLGYRPRDSLVLIGLRGPGDHPQVVVRTDLPGRGAGPPAVRAVVREVAATVRRRGASSVVAVICARQALPAVHPLAGLLARELPATGLHLLDLVAAGPAGHRSLLCAAGCHPDAPPAGEPSGTVPGDRAEPGPPREPPAGAEGVVARTRWWRRWTAALAGGTTTPQDAAALAPALSDPWLRDALLVDALGGTDHEIAALLAGPAAATPGPGARPTRHDLLDRLLDRAPAPHTDRLARADRLLADAARLAAPGDRADPLATRAHLLWYQGRSGQAAALAAEALDEAPGHRLAGLIARVLAAGLDPPWAPVTPGPPVLGRTGDRPAGAGSHDETGCSGPDGASYHRPRS